VIAAHFGIPCVAVGETLRDHVAKGTDIGRTVQHHLDRGELAPDEVVLDLVRQGYGEAKAAGGEYVIDGVPRTMAQARAMYIIGVDLKMNANIALHLQADDDELMRRLLARAAVEHRADDTEQVIRRRLASYHEVTHPIVAWYAERGILVSVDAMRPAARVGREILAELEAMRTLVDYVPEHLRRPIDLTGLDAAFGHATAERT
jgi:adenylate kinase